MEWVSMLRLRMAAMITLATAVGAVLGAGSATILSACFEAGLYVALVTGCASILNQVLERDTDALMERTRHRPLVTGRIDVLHASAMAVAMGVLGTVGLALRFGLLPAVLVLATLVVYVGVYTPLKRVTSLNTAVGAIPGAAPPLIGYAALAGEVGPWGWSLFATIFAWQFPHFMAIAWLYREDYARAGHRMLPALEGADGMAGRQAVLYSLAGLPILLLPVLAGMAGPLYAVGALALGVGYLAASIAFALQENRRRARALLHVSLAYLPLLFALILLDPVVRATILVP
jgi:protoheme IX farnesyltransferase